MDKEAKSALEKIKDWYEKEENTEFVRKSLFTTGGGLTGFIVNRLIGKKGWLADILATGAGMAGGYGLSLLDDPKVTANKEQTVVNIKNEEMKKLKEQESQERQKAANAERGEIVNMRKEIAPGRDVASSLSDEEQRKLSDAVLKKSGYVAIRDKNGNTMRYESVSGNDPILDTNSNKVFWQTLGRLIINEPVNVLKAGLGYRIYK